MSAAVSPAALLLLLAAIRSASSFGYVGSAPSSTTKFLCLKGSSTRRSCSPSSTSLTMQFGKGGMGGGMNKMGGGMNKSMGGGMGSSSFGGGGGMGSSSFGGGGGMGGMKKGGMGGGMGMKSGGMGGGMGGASSGGFVSFVFTPTCSTRRLETQKCNCMFFRDYAGVTPPCNPTRHKHSSSSLTKGRRYSR